MRIICEFRDYYDGIQTPGAKEPLYLRKRRETSFFGPWTSPWYSPVFLTNGVTHALFLGFCGKVYPVLRVAFGERATSSGRDCYSVDEALEFIEAGREKRTRRYAAMERRRIVARVQQYFGAAPAAKQRRSRPGTADSTIRGSQKLLADFEQFFADRTPIWLASQIDHSLAFNPCLRVELPSFIERFPPAQAFQEIAMWLGNQGSPEKPIPIVDDETLAAAKGFDKFSFRKDKQNPRKRR